MTIYHFIEENTKKIGKFLFSGSEQHTLKHSSTNLFVLSPSSCLGSFGGGLFFPGHTEKNQNSL